MIINAQTWRRWNTKENQYDYCYLFGDLHIFHAINQTHQQQLLGMFERLDNKKDALVLVEDITHEPSCSHQLAKIFHTNTAVVCSGLQSSSPMISLVTYLRQRSMQAFNVDNNRYIQQLIGNFLSIHTQAVDIDSWRKRIESFCGVQLQEIFDAPTLDEVAQNFFAFHKLTIAAVAQELCDTVAEIKSYNDGELLNAYYARIANRVVEQVSETFGNQSISALLENKQTVFEYYCALPTAELKQQFIQRCLVFNVEVIDASALHRMYQTPKHKTFIFMGALHIANLQNIVEKLGYERIAAYGPDLYTSVQTWLHDPLKTYYSLDGSLFDKTANTTEFGWYQWGKSIYKKVTNYFQ